MMRLSPEKFWPLLQERGLSVAQCAALAGLQVDTVYDILRCPARRPRYATLWRLARALQCRIEDIADSS